MRAFFEGSKKLESKEASAAFIWLSVVCGVLLAIGLTIGY